MVQSRQIQLTIQGQTVSSSFASVPSAIKTVSGYVAVGIENRVMKSTDRLRSMTDSDRALLGEMFEDSYRYYRQLVERPDFIEFLGQATPFSYFALANHSSRPSKRRGTLSLDNIRAISFVASWNQMKLSIPGYFGFGYALEQAIARHSQARIAELYRDSRFFKAMVTDSYDVLVRTDERFMAYLADDQKFKDIYALLCQETTRSREMLKQIHAKPITTSVKIRENVQRPAVWLQQYCINEIKRGDNNEEDVKFYQDMIVKLMAVIINASRNSA